MVTKEIAQSHSVPIPFILALFSFLVDDQDFENLMKEFNHDLKGVEKEIAKFYGKNKVNVFFKDQNNSSLIDEFGTVLLQIRSS